MWSARFASSAHKSPPRGPVPAGPRAQRLLWVVLAPECGTLLALGTAKQAGFFCLTIELSNMEKQWLHSHKPWGAFLTSPVCASTQAQALHLSGLLAPGTEAGLKFTIMVPGAPFAMMGGTVWMPRSSAACWVTLQEEPLPAWELVSPHWEPLALRCPDMGFLSLGVLAPFGCK